MAIFPLVAGIGKGLVGMSYVLAEPDGSDTGSRSRGGTPDTATVSGVDRPGASPDGGGGSEVEETGVGAPKGFGFGTTTIYTRISTLGFVRCSPATAIVPRCAAGSLTAVAERLARTSGRRSECETERPTCSVDASPDDCGMVLAAFGQAGGVRNRDSASRDFGWILFSDTLKLRSMNKGHGAVA